jgi:hypothetical protein
MDRYRDIPIIKTKPTVQYPKVINYRASVRYPDIPLSENDISVMITPRINAGLYVSESNSFSFKVKRIKGSFLRKEYIEFDYFVIGERKDIKLQVEQDK